MKTLFKNSKVLIGMVHLKPMPGFPNSADNMDVLIDSALSDARALVRGGVDGLIV